jgi:hypothetical protein
MVEQRVALFVVGFRFSLCDDEDLRFETTRKPSPQWLGIIRKSTLSDTTTSNLNPHAQRIRP